jgi:tetratricopeptide (TPR) repeat protein
VRITAQLIRASDDRHLWSERYEADLSDVLAIQNKVARAVAREIEAKLTAREKTTLARTRVVVPEAYQYFLKGNYFLYKGIAGVGRSVEFFKQAIRLDASHSESYSGLAEALCYAGIFGLRPSADTYPEARQAATEALKLDASNAAAHNALGDVKQGYDWDLRGAEAEFKRSLQLNPSHLLTRLWYAECLSRMRRYDESLEESGRALQIDPVSAASLTNRAMLFFRARRFDQSIQAAQQSLDLDPTIINALWWQGLSYAGKQNFPASIVCLTKAESVNSGPLFRGLLGHVYGLAGKRADALAVLDKLTFMAKQRFVSPMDFAIVYAGLGERDLTFHWLDTAYRNRSIRIQELPSMYFDKVRSDPRYSELVRSIGLS